MFVDSAQHVLTVGVVLFLKNSLRSMNRVDVTSAEIAIVDDDVFHGVPFFMMDHVRCPRSMMGI